MVWDAGEDHETVAVEPLLQLGLEAEHLVFESDEASNLPDGWMTDDLALAFELADLAADIASSRFGSADLSVEMKADGSPVTDADIAVETALRAHLARRRPDHDIIGEELGATTGTHRWRWLIDPIDGTSNFIAGSPWWSTLIALADRESVVLGVISAPARNQRSWAERGQGAFLDGKRLAVSRTPKLAGATICDDYRKNIASNTDSHPLVKLSTSCQRVLPHQGNTFVAVADGRADIAIGTRGGPWDYAPLWILVEEAGGRVTDLSGGNNLGSGTCLATNGLLHDEALVSLR